MADEAAPPPKEPKTKKLMPILVVAGLMLAEGVLIFVGVKFLGGGADDAGAAEVVAEDEAAVEDDPADVHGDLSEITIAETDTFNNLSGRLYIYHIRVCALVKEADREVVETVFQEREATVLDRVNTVIRSADPNHLNEPGLETIRRQLQFELNKLTENDSALIEILIPKLLQSRASL